MNKTLKVTDMGAIAMTDQIVDRRVHRTRYFLEDALIAPSGRCTMCRRVEGKTVESSLLQRHNEVMHRTSVRRPTM